MADASWESEARGGDDGRTLKRVMKVLAWGVALVLGLVAVGVALTFSLQQKTRTQAWPTARNLVAALAQDDQAARLYRAHPALRGNYPSEAAFLEQVRTWRPLLGTLPEQPTPGFQNRSMAGYLWVIAQGSGGGWLEFRMSTRSFGGGEMLMVLDVAETPEALKAHRKAVRDERCDAAWSQAEGLFEASRTEGGLDAWLKAQGDLPGKEALRPRLMALRPRLEALQGQDRESLPEGVDLHWRVTDEETLAQFHWKGTSEALELTYRGERLAGLQVKVP